MENGKHCKFILTSILFTIIYFTCCYAFAETNEGEEYYQKAKEYMQERDADNAIIYLEKAIALGYVDSNIYGILGGLYLVKGSKDEARKYLTIALNMFEKELAGFRQSNDIDMINRTTKLIEKTKKQIVKCEE